uniref:Uncharacterized protein n=1 Tax=Arundo donax TaxID=35708 RepID=A0A0A9AMI5_ARUDO
MLSDYYFWTTTVKNWCLVLGGTSGMLFYFLFLTFEN